ncbi:MAG: TIGR02301 family protein [Alphaproteobacteria bacterium]|nr:TIGR02301 family protein [Alphaproteobacteria bacterium]
MRRFAGPAALLLAAALGLAPAQAQAQAARPGESYSSRVVELSRVLGGAHYIRILCVGRGDQTWREMMTRLIDLEAPVAGPQRSAMVDAFNAGYRSEEERFPSCSPEAQAVEAELKGKGRRLSAALAAPHRAE